MDDTDEVLNPVRLVEAYEDDVEAIANLLGLARDTEARYIASLREGMSHGDLAAVSRAAHSIKGSASNIGAMVVSGIAARIEDEAKAGRWDALPTLADDLDRRYAELCERIARYAANIA